jgi:thiol:disulfide interchange protein
MSSTGHMEGFFASSFLPHASSKYGTALACNGVGTEGNLPMGLKTSTISNSLSRFCTALVLVTLIALPLAIPGHAQSALTTPFVKKNIYPESANPTADIAAALKKARAEHKRVILDFGGDWCGDCQVLEIYFHEKPNAALLAKHFVLVPIFIGQMDRNLDVAKKYNVPVQKGVPALAVLDANGKLLYSQQTGQFGHMRDMSVSAVTEFLNRWKA